MYKFYSALLVFVLIISSGNQSFSQPKFTLDVTAGYSQPIGGFNNGISLYDTIPDSWPYLMRSAYNIGVTGKMTIKSVPNLKAVLGLNYNGFKNWDDLAVTSYNSNTGNYDTDTVQFRPKVAILVLSLGGEWGFKPKEDFNPFVGLDFTTNFYSGSFQSNPSSNFQKSQLKAETRFGLQMGGGFNMAFSKYVGGVFGIKYNLANLMGKSDGDLNDTTHVYLNDSGEGNQGSRNISYFQFYAGVSFYFDNPMTTKK